MGLRPGCARRLRTHAAFHPECRILQRLGRFTAPAADQKSGASDRARRRFPFGEKCDVECRRRLRIDAIGGSPLLQIEAGGFLGRENEALAWVAQYRGFFSEPLLANARQAAVQLSVTD